MSWDGSVVREDEINKRGERVRPKGFSEVLSLRNPVTTERPSTHQHGDPPCARPSAGHQAAGTNGSGLFWKLIGHRVDSFNSQHQGIPGCWALGRAETTE